MSYCSLDVMNIEAELSKMLPKRRRCIPESNMVEDACEDGLMTPPWTLTLDIILDNGTII